MIASVCHHRVQVAQGRLEVAAIAGLLSDVSVFSSQSSDVGTNIALSQQCDKRVPQCGQCIRAREKCRGYRDEWELVFRDQTNHTIKRSTKKAASVVEVTHLSPPSRGLGPDLDEMGVNYFLQDFVTGGGRAPSRGYLNYIPTAYCDDAEHPTLVASMAAVGLVALATKQPELVRHARAKYSEAISHVNHALASPIESVKDSTLMSVISLGVFEHVSNFESWVRHVKGAAALVIARGKSQFSRRTGILMFNQVRADMTAACIQSIQPFPDDMRELQEEATKYTDHTDAFWLLGVLATRCATLFAGVTWKNNNIPSCKSWPEFLDESIALQDDFHYVLDLLSVQEPYTTIQEPGGKEVSVSYHGRYDVYQTSWAIRIWNNARMVEIIVCEIVCWLINKIITLDPDLPAEVRLKLGSKLQYAAQIMSKRGEEILASVPQGLGLVLTPEHRHPALYPSPPSVSGGYMLIWNLYTVGKSPVIDDQDRKWVIDRLKDISESAGIEMSLQLAQDLINIKQSVS